MNLSGASQIVLHVSSIPNHTQPAKSRLTRIGSKDFNRILKSGRMFTVCDTEGNAIVPSKGVSWGDVGAAIRASKKVPASVDKPRVRKSKKPVS